MRLSPERIHALETNEVLVLAAWCFWACFAVCPKSQPTNRQASGAMAVESMHHPHPCRPDQSVVLMAKLLGKIDLTFGDQGRSDFQRNKQLFDLGGHKPKASTVVCNSTHPLLLLNQQHKDTASLFHTLLVTFLHKNALLHSSPPSQKKQECIQHQQHVHCQQHQENNHITPHH